MEWFFFAAALVCYIVFQGLRLRCPLCSKYTIHPKNKEKEDYVKDNYENLKKAGLLDSLKGEYSPLSSKNTKPGYANAHFLCKSCGHNFSRKESMIWNRTAAKLGDDVAINEYRKVIQK
jgi:transposase-like protein